MAKRFTKPSINWLEIEKRVPPEQRTNFLSFKAKSDNYLRRVLSSPPEAPAINWEEYQKSVPVAGLVDKFKSAYSSLKVPYPEDKLSAKVDEQWAKMQGEVKKFTDEMQKEIAEAQKQLDYINSLPAFDEMTLDMAYDMYPQWALDPIHNPTYWPHDDAEQLWNHPDITTGEKKGATKH